MKKILAIITAVAAILLCTAPQASAQFRFGLQVGTNVNDLHFNSSVLDSHNRMGYNIGALIEFTVPGIGVGGDLGVRYVRRNSNWADANGESLSDNRDYIEIPLNFKWKINIPVINSVVRPFLTTGPSFAFLTSRSIHDTYRNKKFDTAWNFGFGLELFKKLQIGASYGLGLTKALEAIDATSKAGITGKNRYWTITAAYLF